MLCKNFFVCDLIYKDEVDFVQGWKFFAAGAAKMGDFRGGKLAEHGDVIIAPIRKVAAGTRAEKRGALHAADLTEQAGECAQYAGGSVQESFLVLISELFHVLRVS